MIGDIRKLVAIQPFVPITIHMADGRRFNVPTRDHILVGGGRVVVLNDDETIDILSGLLMSGVTTDASSLSEHS